MNHAPSCLRPFYLAMVLGGLLLCQGTTVLAGGLFLPGHGVRGFGRGGAFTAGGDDPGGIWYNPATIGEQRGINVLVDGALLFYSLDYARVDSGGNPLPPVSNEGPLLPLPNLAMSASTGIPELWFGVGFSAPYAPLPGYPEPDYGPCDPVSPVNCLDTAHWDAPQRYSLISLDGTVFMQLDLALAYRLLPGLVLGLSVQNLFANFVSLNSITSYNGTLSSGPEDPEFDSLSQMKMLDLFNPSAKVGLLYEIHPRVKLGVSVQLPFWVGGSAKVKVQLPVSSVYEKASVEGEDADVSMILPLIVRTGLEVRPRDDLRLEVGFDWEQWSLLETISIKPKNIFILNIPSIDRYLVPELAIQLNFRDSLVGRLGAEYFLSALPLILRGGYVFERGAVDDPYASALAMDNNKHVLTFGAGYVLAGYRLDVLFVHAFMPSRTVDYRASRSLQVNPINPSGAVAVGAGTYQGSFTIIGLGAAKRF